MINHRTQLYTPLTRPLVHWCSIHGSRLCLHLMLYICRAGLRMLMWCFYFHPWWIAEYSVIAQGSMWRNTHMLVINDKKKPQGQLTLGLILTGRVVGFFACWGQFLDPNVVLCSVSLSQAPAHIHGTTDSGAESDGTSCDEERHQQESGGSSDQPGKTVEERLSDSYKLKSLLSQLEAWRRGLM